MVINSKTFNVDKKKHRADLVKRDHGYEVLVDGETYYKTANELFAVQRMMEV